MYPGFLQTTIKYRIRVKANTDVRIIIFISILPINLLTSPELGVLKLCAIFFCKVLLLLENRYFRDKNYKIKVEKK